MVALVLKYLGLPQARTRTRTAQQQEEHPPCHAARVSSDLRLDGKLARVNPHTPPSSRAGSHRR